jgi:hypothetical protein
MSPWSRSSWSHTDLPRLREGMVAAQVGVAVVTVSQLCSSSMCRSTARKLIERLLFFISFILPLSISIPFHYFNRFLLSLSFIYLSSLSLSSLPSFLQFCFSPTVCLFFPPSLIISTRFSFVLSSFVFLSLSVLFPSVFLPSSLPSFLLDFYSYHINCFDVMAFRHKSWR